VASAFPVLASNDAGAQQAVAGLVSELGFAPIRLGRVDEGGRLIVFGGNGEGGAGAAKHRQARLTRHRAAP